MSQFSEHGNSLSFPGLAHVQGAVPYAEEKPCWPESVSSNLVSFSKGRNSNHQEGHRKMERSN